ncbi:hypothetical protein [Edaphovirga cremea]|uniref:hypothetical protein n=1 Tax=Edaphovirga cremea TaxID=2267246 RepID=UPI000DEF4B0A|nr:hypothetical protein [Edaphovirga cremea]
MTNEKALPALDAEKLRENSLLSIQLGIEDFELSQRKVEDGGNPARALSSVRNLFAGMLLLFKYKIATSVDEPEDAYTLIYNPPKILPRSDGNGGVEWVPDGNFKSTTIDTEAIKQRFKGFNIEVDWKAIKQLQDCRNGLEHMPPENTLGEIAGFVADLFPVLSDFITQQLEEAPFPLLGSSWEIMLKHNTLYEAKRKECNESWSFAGIPKHMERFLQECRCDMCHSDLLAASDESLDGGCSVESNEDEFKYRCLACGFADLIAPLLMQALNDEHDYDWRSGEDSNIEDCFQCGHGTFLIAEQLCVWCGATLDHEECIFCGEHLKQDDQDNGGLCGYHYHLHTKDD